MAAAASASASSAASSAGSFAHAVSSHHSAIIGSVRLDVAGLMAAHPPRSFARNCSNKQVVQDLIRAAKVAPPQTLMRFSRWNSVTLALAPQNLISCDTEFELFKGVYQYDDAKVAKTETHFHVNFADKHLFGFYDSSLFAQDEWMCLEHLATCSLREYLLVRDAAGEDAFSPLTVSKLKGQQYAQPTPVVVMNVPRDCSIDAVGAKLYGHAFDNATPASVKAATKVLDPPTLSHIIAMEALKHKHGMYTVNQICTTLQTACTTFAAARAEATQEFADAKSYIKKPTVVVHTGNWGCGAFGGNVELMCLLQLIAARVAGIDRVVYHVLSADNEMACMRAMKTLGQLVEQLTENDGGDIAPVDLEQVAATIAALKYAWGQSNGT